MNANQPKTTVLAWHFTGEKLRDGRPVPPVGEWLVHEGPLKMCEAGYHASVDPFDALTYAPGSILHRVECRTDIEHKNDKLVCRERRILRSVNMGRELHLFACHCVRHTPLKDGRVVWDLLADERSRNAVEVAERYANGQATQEELEDARDAAWDAAGYAAYAARDAALAAELAAEGDAGYAARCAAWAAAGHAAREWQRHEFNRVVSGLFREE